MFIIVLEPLCNLLPDRLVFFLDGIEVIRSNPKPACLLCSIMVDVDNHIHILLNAVIYDVLNTAYPFVIDCIAVIIIYHCSPCNRNPHSIEAVIMYGLYDLLCCLNMLPERLIRSKPGMSIHGISKIPSGSHLLNHLLCRKHTERLLCGCRDKPFIIRSIYTHRKLCHNRSCHHYRCRGNRTHTSK